MGLWRHAPNIEGPPNTDDVAVLVDYVKKLANTVAMMSKDLEFIVNGTISSDNVREIAGYNVSSTELKHKSGIVGMNGADPQDPNAIRFWSGNADPTQAPFRVSQSGILTAVAALFLSALGYPRVELNSGSSLFAAYRIASDFIKIHAEFTGSPTIEFNNGSANAILSAAANTLILNTLLGDLQLRSQSGNTLISAAGNMNINGSVRFNNGSALDSISQPNSTATTVAGLANDFNTLLRNLREMNILS